jgi:hypothetical protein
MVMAIVNVSLDTETRNSVITINGILVPSTDYLIERYAFDGEDFIRFSYTVEDTVNGLKERRQFFLPDPDVKDAVAVASVDERGFASKILHNDDKAKADVVDFIEKNRDRS